MSHQQYWQQMGQWEQYLDENSTKDKHMKISEMIESKYLKQSDVDGILTVTVDALKKENLAREDEEPEYKWTVRFRELPKAMVVNVTNLKRLARALGDDSDGWLGQKVQLYVDPDIEYAGNVVGGLRIRGIERKVARPKTDDKFIDEANSKFDDARDIPF